MYQLYLLFWTFPTALGSKYALSNADVKMALEEWPPFVTIHEDGNGKVTHGGILWDYVEYVQQASNFTLTVVRPVDGLWGNCFGKNNCTGMIGMVQRKEVDFALGMCVKGDTSGQ